MELLSKRYIIMIVTYYNFNLKKMKKIIVLTSLILITISCSNAQPKAFSKESLAYELTNLEGKKATFQSVLDKNKGKKIVIEIWAGWCGDCVKAMPKVKELQVNNPNVAYVFISMDKTMEKWQEAIAKHDVKGDSYWANDPKMMKGIFGKAIDLDWIPRYIVMNEKGEIVIYRAIETDFDKIDQALKQK
jgi:thiol-disulfide isomerase/thioredoxin